MTSASDTHPAAEYSACPTDVVEAPLEVVWGLLTDPARWGEFFDVRITGVEPAGPAHVGQRFRGESGPRVLHLVVRFAYTRVDTAPHRLGMDIQLPFGITVREDLDVVPLGAARCRVNYHCHFGFPPGWRGRVARVLLGRELDAGPADSLARLKSAAERRAAAA